MLGLLVALTLFATPAPVPRLVGSPRAGDEVIVLLRPGATAQQVLPGGVVLRHFTSLPGFVARVTANELAQLSVDPRVATLEADQLGHVETDEAAVLTGARTVTRELGLTGKGLRFALLDTGVERTHPDLDGGVVLEKCFVLGGCPPMNTDTGDLAPEGSGHGTHVAGIITSDGRVGPRGVAPNAEVITIRVFNNQAVGRVSDWVAALDWVLSVRELQQIRLVNMSVGTDMAFPGACDGDQPALTEAVGRLRDAGVVLFASAGNENVANGMTAPACVHGVIAVGATYDSDLGREPDNGTYSSGCFDENADAGSVACFSNSSDELDLLAPGSRIRSSVPGGSVGEKRGTSQASPHAAAIAALMLELDPLLTPDDLERLLKSTGVPKMDPKNGRVTPLVNAVAALQQVRESECSRRAVGAACEVSRSCDAGVCAVSTGTCSATGCVFTLPAAESQFPAACGCSASGSLFGLALLLLSRRRRLA
jgi:subtilisin family serine protease